MMRDDPELGIVRLCRECREWWPFDGEFWHMRGGRLHPSWPARCIACCGDYFARRRRIAQRIERDNRAIPPPVEGRCNALTGHTRRERCGRFPDHRNGHRSAAAMANECRRKHAA